MQKMNTLQGVVPVLLTPLTASGDVDEPALIRLVDYLNNKNIGGFWVLGTGAEDMNLTYNQRLHVAKVVTKANAGRVPIILGAGFFAMQDTLNFIKDTSHLQFDAYHVMPYHPLLSLARIKWLYKHLADFSPKPIWMYTSANWCRFIPPDFIEDLREYPNIAGIKFSTSNAVHTEKVISLASEEFQVITAVVKQFFSSLCLGVKGGTTVEACPYPDMIIEIYEQFKSGNLKGSLKAQRELNRLLEKMPEEPGKDNFLKVAEAKFILSLKHICSPYVSGYYRELTKDEQTRIKKILSEHKLI
jgi:4-hydroxy-tetrahydrodipicolinate synthase